MSTKAAREIREAEKKRNFIIYAIEGAIFSFGSIFISQEAVLPVFLAQLGASPETVSMVPVAAQIGQGLPGLFVAKKVQRLATRKEYVILTGLGQRIPWLVSGIATALLAQTQPQLLVAVILLCFLVSTLSGGLTLPAFFDLIAATVRSDRRGTLTAIRSGVSYILGIGGGFAVKGILSEVPYPWNYTMLYGIATVLFALNLFLFSKIREPRGMYVPKDSDTHILREIYAVLADNPGFRWFVVAKSLLALSLATCAFFPVYLVHKFSLGYSASGTFAIIAGFTYLIINPLLGWLGDRKGYRLVMIGGALTLLASGLLGLSGTGTWAAFGLIAAAAIGRTVSLLSWNFEMDFAPQGSIPVFVSASGAVLGIIAPVGLLAGFLASRFGYGAVFGMTAVTASLSLIVMLLRVPEPRTRHNHSHGGTES